jgi:hypothetical protein
MWVITQDGGACRKVILACISCSTEVLFRSADGSDYSVKCISPEKARALLECFQSRIALGDCVFDLRGYKEWVSEDR